MALLSLRTRTVLRLMLTTVGQGAWTVVKILVHGVLLLGYLLSALAVNVLSANVLNTAWKLWATPGASWPPSLVGQTVGILAMSAVTIVVFWTLVLRNRSSCTASRGPLCNNWVMGLPNPRATVRSPWPDAAVMLVMSGLYLANGFALFLSFGVVTAALVVLAGLGWAISTVWGGVESLIAPLPVPSGAPATAGTLLPAWKRALVRISSAWDERSQRLLEANPQVMVELEQKVLRKDLPPGRGEVRRPRSRL